RLLSLDGAEVLLRATVPEPGLLRDRRRPVARRLARRAGDRSGFRTQHRRRLQPDELDDALRALLGGARRAPVFAFQRLLLPRHRGLHRAGAAALRAGRRRRAQARPRLRAYRDPQRPLPAPPALGEGGRRRLPAGSRRDRATHPRAERPVRAEAYLPRASGLSQSSCQASITTTAPRPLDELSSAQRKSPRASSHGPRARWSSGNPSPSDASKPRSLANPSPRSA